MPPAWRSFQVLQAGWPVANVGLQTKVIEYDGSDLRVAAIGWVVTEPEHEGKGLATTLLRCALDRARACHLPFALLFTGVEGFYRRLDFRTAPNVLVQGAMVLTLGEERTWSPHVPVKLLGPEW